MGRVGVLERPTEAEVLAHFSTLAIILYIGCVKQHSNVIAAMYGRLSKGS